MKRYAYARLEFDERFKRLFEASIHPKDIIQGLNAITAERCREIFESIPAQLAREHKKFIYGIVKEGARGRDYEDALHFLVSAGLLYRINRAGEISLPLKVLKIEKLLSRTF